MLKTTLGLSVFQLVNRFYKLASETLRPHTDARCEALAHGEGGQFVQKLLDGVWVRNLQPMQVFHN